MPKPKYSQPELSRIITPARMPKGQLTLQEENVPPYDLDLEEYPDGLPRHLIPTPKQTHPQCTFEQSTSEVEFTKYAIEDTFEGPCAVPETSYLHQRDYIQPNTVSHIPAEQLVADSIRYALNATQILHTGTKFGSVHPNHPAYEENLKKIKEQLGVSTLILPKLFNIAVTSPTSLSSNLLEIHGDASNNNYRTASASDAIFMSRDFVRTHNIGIGFMTAGTHVLTFEGGNYVAASHAPITSLLHPETHENIIDQIVQQFIDKDINPEDISMHITTGALGCCLGWNTTNEDQIARNERIYDALQHRYELDVVGRINRGPRKGGFSLHLDKIAIRAATNLGLKHIEVDSICTSCHGHESLGTMDTHGTYFDGQHSRRTTETSQGFNNRNFVGITWN